MLDPVYSGKALYHFLKVVGEAGSGIRPGQNVLFLHTGGVLGLYDKVDQLMPILGKFPTEKLVIDKSLL